MRHHIRLYATQETADHLAFIDERVFSTVEGLKRYIATLPPGDSLLIERIGDQSPESPFFRAMHELRALCEERQLKFAERHYDP